MEGRFRGSGEERERAIENFGCWPGLREEVQTVWRQVPKHSSGGIQVVSESSVADMVAR